MRHVRLTAPARRDISNILRRSGNEFGTQARTRYRQLLDRALQDIGDDPTRIGVRAIDDVRAGYSTYHLKYSTKNEAVSRVRNPRHLLAFYIDDRGDVIIARVFHERQMLARHLGDEDEGR